jgi:hypothetical protein
LKLFTIKRDSIGEDFLGDTMKISVMQKLIVIGGIGSCLQIYAMHLVAEPIATYEMGFNEKLEITPSLVQNQGHKFLVIVAAQRQAGKGIERSRSSLELSAEKTPATSKITSADQNVGTEESSDKDETLSASSEHFSAEVEVGKKGSWFHCKTRCKSKTLAKYGATALGGFLVGLLAL